MMSVAHSGTPVGRVPPEVEVVARHTAARSGRSACAPFARAQAQVVMAMVDASRSAPARARGENRAPGRSVTTRATLPAAVARRAAPLLRLRVAERLGER